MGLFKNIIILLLLCCTCSLYAQTRPGATIPGAASSAVKPHGLPIQIRSSRPDGKLDAIVITKGGKSVTNLKGGVTFSQGNANMTSDSAHFYSEQNSLEAFGHVVIHQADTVTITGDRLYYDGNTRIAQMFDHCVMTDKQGVLTTDRLNYDLGTKIGTYYDGGKIINKDNILVSRTGYYYENTKICYFKSDVSILTPQTTIKSDTLQFNTATHIAYFFGPTRIQSRDDFIYCENGQYNTATDQASFRQHAYYLNGSKKLVGDSLYYDKRSGFGKAVGHVTFSDSTDNGIIKGGIAQYNKVNEQTFVTQKPLFIFLTTSSDTVKAPVTKEDSLKAAALKNARPVREKNPTYAQILEGHTEEIPAGQPGSNPSHAPIPDLSGRKKPVAPAPHVVIREKVDSLFLTADTLMTLSLTGDRARPHLAPKIPLKVRNRPFGHDSLGRRAELLLARIKSAVIEDSIKLKQGNMPLTLGKPVTRNQKNVAGLKTAPEKTLRPDTISSGELKPLAARIPKPVKRGFFSRLFGKKDVVKKTVDTVAAAPVRISARQLDSLKKQLAFMKGQYDIPDLLAGTPAGFRKGLGRPFTFADTTHFRVIFAYHHSKLFKSDFQAAADSLVYTYVDSTIRCFKDPALWTEGTQMTGDTISVRLKNRKIDSLIIIHSSFIISRVDSLKNKERFNQISGRDMYGKFSNNHLEHMRVEGNGKSLYYATEDKPDTLTHKVISNISGLNSEIGSYFLMRFKNNKAEQFTAVDEPQGHFYPAKKIDPAIERLKGFYWRESERPRSKADLFKKPGKAEIREDSVANKRSSRADSTSDEYSENILDIPKPKVKKAVKGKTVTKKAEAQTPAETLTPVDNLILKPAQPAKSAAPASQYQFVPPTDSTLSREGIGDTTTRHTGAPPK